MSVETQRFDLVIFDCDGVLVDSEPIVNALYVDMMRARGHEIDEAASLRAHSGSHMAARLAAYGKQFNWTPEPGFGEEFHMQLAPRLERDLRPVAGVATVLAQLDVPLAVASNGMRREILFRLAAADLSAFFGDRIFSAVDIGVAKPSPDVYIHAAQACGVHPSRCAVVEDSVVGVHSGVAAGMRVFGYCALSDPALLREAGAAVFFDMRELHGMIASEYTAR